MERLDLRLVEYFIAVAEELHFGRAAARLHIAQPSLSHQIRRLEQHLGVTLLRRTSRHVELTPAGEAFLREGRRTLAHAQRAIQSARAAVGERIVVGFSGSAATALLPDVLRAFSQQHPSVDVSLRELLLDGVEDVLGGEVDVAFIRLQPGQIGAEVEVLAREPRVVALPVDHPLATRDSVTFADLRDEDFITNPVVKHSGPPVRWLAEQHRHGLSGRVVAQAASLQEILTLVSVGRGVCLVPEPVARDYPRADVSYVGVSDADPALVSLAWRADTLRPALEAFIQAARHTAANSSPATAVATN
jgi:DNA-binding transcriptional LysR family regulator